MVDLKGLLYRGPCRGLASSVSREHIVEEEEEGRNSNRIVGLVPGYRILGVQEDAKVASDNGSRIFGEQWIFWSI